MLGTASSATLSPNSTISSNAGADSYPTVTSPALHRGRRARRSHRRHAHAVRSHGRRLAPHRRSLRPDRPARCDRQWLQRQHRRLTSDHDPPGTDLSVGGVVNADIDFERSVVTLPSDVVVDAGGIGVRLAADRPSLACPLGLTGRWSASAVTWPWLAYPQTSTAGALASSIPTAPAAAGARWPPGRRCRHLEYPVTTLDRRRSAATTSSILYQPPGEDRSRRRHHRRSKRWLAEIHATAAMLSGSRHALDYLESHDLTGIVFPLHGSPLVT